MISEAFEPQSGLDTCRSTSPGAITWAAAAGGPCCTGGAEVDAGPAAVGSPAGGTSRGGLTGADCGSSSPSEGLTGAGCRSSPSWNGRADGVAAACRPVSAAGIACDVLLRGAGSGTLCRALLDVGSASAAASAAGSWLPEVLGAGRACSIAWASCCLAAVPRAESPSPEELASASVGAAAAVAGCLAARAAAGAAPSVRPESPSNRETAAPKPPSAGCALSGAGSAAPDASPCAERVGWGSAPAAAACSPAAGADGVQGRPAGSSPVGAALSVLGSGAAAAGSCPAGGSSE